MAKRSHERHGYLGIALHNAVPTHTEYLSKVQITPAAEAAKEVTQNWPGGTQLVTVQFRYLTKLYMPDPLSTPTLVHTLVVRSGS